MILEKGSYYYIDRLPYGKRIVKCWSFSPTVNNTFWVIFTDLEDQTIPIYIDQQEELRATVTPTSDVLNKYLKLFSR